MTRLLLRKLQDDISYVYSRMKNVDNIVPMQQQTIRLPNIILYTDQSSFA